MDINANLTSQHPEFFCMISGFHHKIDESCVLVGHYYAASSCNYCHFERNPTVPTSMVRNPRRDLGP